MGALLVGLKALGPGRLAGMAAVSVALFALLAVLALHGAGPGGGRMALLYADLDLREAAQIADQLDAQHIAHEVTASGDRVLVAEAEVGRVRLLLARQGLPSGGSIGYELFDRGDGLTATAFQQQINQERALEGELARSIRLIDGVRAARVHLVLPRREPFAREQQAAQASVLLTMAGAQRLDREGVQAVLNLVAAAVPGLRAKAISVIDSRGDVLARAGEATDGAGGAQSLQEVKRSTELRLARAVEEMLDRVLGPGHTRAEASVDLDFAQTHETQERFDPEGQVVRSTQTVNGSSRSTEATPTVSVQNNLPNADAGGREGAGSQDQKQEETTNYEISKTVRTMVRDQPEIRRISLAVLVDGQVTPGADGKPQWQKRSADEMDRITALVRSAIGFDEKRGDKVDVVNLRFAADDAPAQVAPRSLLGIPLDTPAVLRLAQTALFGVLGILGLLLVLRPMVLRLTALHPPALLAGSADAAGGTGAGLAMLAAPAMGPAGGAPAGRIAGGLPALPAPPGTALARLPGAGPADDDTMMDLVNVHGQIRASSVRRIADLVERHPDESLAVVRGWLQLEGA